LFSLESINADARAAKHDYDLTLTDDNNINNYNNNPDTWQLFCLQCERSVTETNGLPCSHLIGGYLLDGEPLPLSICHPYWRIPQAKFLHPPRARNSKKVGEGGDPWDREGESDSRIVTGTVANANLRKRKRGRRILSQHETVLADYSQSPVSQLPVHKKKKRSSHSQHQIAEESLSESDTPAAVGIFNHLKTAFKKYF